MKFIDVDEPVVTTDDPYYDLFDGGYIDPHSLLEDSDDAEEVCEAIQLIKDFISKAVDVGVLEVQ